MLKVGEFFAYLGGLLLMGGPLWSIGRKPGERQVARQLVTVGAPMLLVGLVIILVGLVT